MADTKNSGSADAHAAFRFARADHQAEQHRLLRRTQALCLGLVLLSLVLTLALVHIASQPRVRPYVVEVDRHGQAVALGPAQELADPDRRVIMHALTLWLVRVRTVTTDRKLLRRELVAAYAYTGGRAVRLLNTWFHKHPPFERAEDETVSITVESILALDETGRRFRVEWTETISTTSGLTKAEERWQALLTLAVDPPDDADQVLTNPLGIRIIDFDWQRLSKPE